MRAEIGILGGGFAGSLAAVLLSQAGRDVVLLDPSQHPRFRIGESSTPTADLLLRLLAERYDVPALDPLTRYGSWRNSYPNLRCGCKRGFSYFRHHPQQPFATSPPHDNELLVAASTSTELADTHWLRADFDLFLFRLAQRFAAAAWDGVAFVEIDQVESGWRVAADRDSEVELFEFDILLDGSGNAGAIGAALGLSDLANQMHTNSRAVFSHLRHVAPWTRILEEHGIPTDDYPFDADLAAQHHVLDEGWVWALRFDGDLTSVGLVSHKERLFDDKTPQQNWQALTSRYPSLHQMVASAHLAEAPGQWVETPRLQRLWNQTAGDNWAMLPGAAGFVDPLHSTGIAHTVSGIARLVDIFERHWKKPSLPDALQRYGQTVQREIRHIDRLVAGCYRALPSFSRFIDYSLLYFTATIGFESECLSARSFAGLGDYLGADQDSLVELSGEALQRVGDRTISDTDFGEWLRQSIAPLQSAGLGDAACRNMYHHTAAE